MHETCEMDSITLTGVDTCCSTSILLAAIPPTPLLLHCLASDARTWLSSRHFEPFNDTQPYLDTSVLAVA